MADYDLVIAGAGLAGLTAALFGARQGLGTLVLESNITGGHLLSIEKIEDYPGFPDGISGYELCPGLQRQAADCGAEFQRSEAQSLKAADGYWHVGTADENHRARAVIVATGSAPKSLDVPGEERLAGRGVSHCASCDGPLYNELTVGVAGGGDSALQEALTLANYAAQVVIFNRAGQFSAQQVYQERVRNSPKIVARHRTCVEEVLGEEVVSGVRVYDEALDSKVEVPLAGIFVYVGLKPNTAILRSLLPLSESGHVPADASMRTELPGLFVAGDIRQNSPSQAITSAGEGAAAAIAAYRYIKDLV